MNSVTFGSQPCLDPLRLAAELRRLGRFVPAELAAGIRLVNPLGRQPARAWFPMLRQHLDALDLNALHTLTLVDGEGRSVEAKNLVIASDPVCLTTSLAADDPNAAYLVEAADARHRVDHAAGCVPCDKQYNVRAPGYGAAAGANIYYASSTNSGTAWTWATMVVDLWDLMSAQLGSDSALPFTPHGTPEGFVFVGVSAWKALCEVLERIGCAVKWDPSLSSGAYSIVQVGADDDDADTLLTSLASRRIADDDFRTVKRGRIPYGVRVFFHRRDTYLDMEKTATRTSSQWQSGAAYSVDVTGPDSDSAETGTYKVLWDDLPALYDATGALSNSAALTARAQERSDDFYRQFSTTTKLHRSYTGLVTATPGSQVRGVAWRTDEQGFFVTEIVRGVGRQLMASASGQWEECSPSTPLQPPAFGPTWTNYPPRTSMVKLATATADGSGRFDALLEHYRTDTLAWTDADSIWVIDANGVTSLTSGTRYLGHLAGYNNSRLVYQINSASGSGFVLTVEEADGSPSYASMTTLRFDQADGFVVTNPSAGVARIDISAASGSTVGIITTGTQTIAGAKTFTGNFEVGGSATATISGGALYSQINTVMTNSASVVAGGTGDGDLLVEGDLQVGGIGTKLGFFGVTTVVQQGSITSITSGPADATYGTDEENMLNDLVTAVNAIINVLMTYGLTA